MAAVSPASEENGERMEASPAHRRGLRHAAAWVVTLEAADRFDRQQALLVLGLGVPWMVYTRPYFWLHPRGLTVAPSLFMHLTGRPDPLFELTPAHSPGCGAVRSCKACSSTRLGPALFLAAFPLLLYAGFVLLGGRAVRLTLPPTARRALVAVIALLFALNWTSKLLWLGV